MVLPLGGSPVRLQTQLQALSCEPLEILHMLLSFSEGPEKFPVWGRRSGQPALGKGWGAPWAGSLGRF